MLWPAASVVLAIGTSACWTLAHAQIPAGADAAASAEVAKPLASETVGGSGSEAGDGRKTAPEAVSVPTPPSEQGVKPAAPTPATAAPAAPVAAPPAPAGGAPAAAASVPPAAASASDGNIGPITRPQVRKDDEWIYRRTSGTTSLLLRQRVTDLNEDGISLITELTGTPDTTTAVYNRQWGLLGSGFNTYTPALAYYSFPLYTGKRWRIDSSVNNFGAGQTGRIAGEGVALGFEMVSTVAGRFLALKVQVEIETADPGDAARTMRVRETHWYARNILRAVKVESSIQVANEPPRQEVIELVSFRLD